MTDSRLIILLCALTAIMSVRAQQRFLPPADTTDTTATASLLTCAPGADVYSLEGHSGLRLRYGTTDIVANWGMFDFSSPNFIYRFVKGETDYSIGICPTDYFLRSYETENRRVTEQSLNLTPPQVADLVEAVEKNLQPGNRIYRYNYVRDNCATRPLRLIEQTIGDSIALTASPAQAARMTTFRNEMRYFHRNYPWYQFGIDICLGSGIDSRISERQMMFAPVILEELAATAIITSGPKKGEPLVRRTRILVDGPAEGPVSDPTPWYLTPIAVMALILAFTIILTIRNRRQVKSGRWFDAIFFTISGIQGCIVAFLMFVSSHEATSPNWLLIWLNPLCLSVPALVFVKDLQKPLEWFHIYNIAATSIFFTIAAAGVQSVNPALMMMAACSLIRSISFTLNAYDKNN